MHHTTPPHHTTMSAERSSQSTFEDFAHIEAKHIASDIMASKRGIARLEQHIKDQKALLETTCPHKYVREEYDDDFHRPRCYVMCQVCDEIV